MMLSDSNKVVFRFSSYEARITACEALISIIKGGDASTILKDSIKGLHEATAKLGQSLVARRYKQFACLLNAISHLLNWACAIRNAEKEADRHLKAAQQCARDIMRELGSDSKVQKLSVVISKIIAISDINQIIDIAESLLQVPLPLPVASEELTEAQPAQEGQRKGTPAISVAFLSFALGGITFEDPQTIEPGISYDLTIEMRVSSWPAGAEKLKVDPVSVEPSQLYQLPSFVFDRPEGDHPYICKNTGRIILNVPQAISSRPLQFKYRAWFIPESCGTDIIVEGQRNLNVQSYDPDRNPQTGYREVDKRLLEIRAEVRKIPGVHDKELDNFLQIMGALGQIAGQALQDNLFPGKWDETSFQPELKKCLRANPKIGSELEEHPHAGGGITDLSFRKARIEIKVEPVRYVEVKDAHNYIDQTAQYVSGSDRRLGVICILDCSPKTCAPGSVANDFALITVSPPGSGERVPIIMGVVIIRGNLSTPSSLSKSKKNV